MLLKLVVHKLEDPEFPTCVGRPPSLQQAEVFARVLRVKPGLWSSQQLSTPAEAKPIPKPTASSPENRCYSSVLLPNARQIVGGILR